jgi:hypothetical protein
LTNVTCIAAGQVHSLALTGARPPVTAAAAVHPSLSTNGFSLSIPSRNGRVYQLESSESLLSPVWRQLPLTPGNGGALTLGDPTAASQRFYRILQW